MQIRAFKARGFFVHWFTHVYTRLKHGYVFHREIHAGTMPLVTRIRIVKPAKGYWFNFDKYRVAPFHRHTPRFIRLILASFSPFFLLFSLFLFFFYFLFSRYLSSDFAIGIQLRSNYWTKLNLFCGIGLIDDRMDEGCRKSVLFWDVGYQSLIFSKLRNL